MTMLIKVLLEIPFAQHITSRHKGYTLWHNNAGLNHSYIKLCSYDIIEHLLLCIIPVIIVKTLVNV